MKKLYEALAIEVLRYDDDVYMDIFYSVGTDEDELPGIGDDFFE